LNTSIIVSDEGVFPLLRVSVTAAVESRTLISDNLSLRPYERQLVSNIMGNESSSIYVPGVRLPEEEYYALLHLLLSWEAAMVNSTVDDYLLFRRPGPALDRCLPERLHFRFQEVVQIASCATHTDPKDDGDAAEVRGAWVTRRFFKLADIFGEYDLAPYMM
jgi:hypothetical protein